MIVWRKREDYQNCAVLYCVTQLYTIIRTLIRAVLTVELFRYRFCVFTRSNLFVLGLVFMLSVFPRCYCLVLSSSAFNCLEKLVSKMTYYVSSGTLNHTHSPPSDVVLLPERDYIRYVHVFAIANPSAVCRLSVMCKVRAPYLGS